MITTSSRTRQPEATHLRLVEAALGLMLRHGFAATSVDDICAAADLSKGSFFHHFENKETIALAAVDLWAERGTALYSEAWKDPSLDPLAQLNLIFDIMVGFNRRAELCLCMVGMMSQELSLENKAMRAACAGHLANWSLMVEHMLAAAKEQRRPVVDFDPAQVAWFLNSLWQGSMLIGKARQSPKMVIQNIELARSYIDSLFGRSASKISKSSTKPKRKKA